MYKGFKIEELFIFYVSLIMELFGTMKKELFETTIK